MTFPVSMKQWTTNEDGIENLKLGTVQIPTPSADEVLVKINAVSINYRDTEVVMGLYNHHKSMATTPNIVPCSDMCGKIVTFGSNTKDKGFNKDDRVMGIFNQTHIDGQIEAEQMKSGLGKPLPGVLCEYRCFPLSGLVKVPAYLSDEQASTLPIAGVTAWMAINGMRPLEQWGGKGEVILIQGTGGVAINGLLLAKAAGATVIITSSSDEKLERCKKLGANYTINYHNIPNWASEVLRLTNNKGADIIFENGGAQTLPQSFNCIAFGGLINCIGYLSGKENDDSDRTNTNILALRRNVTLKGILNGPRTRFEELLRFCEEHRVIPVVDKVFAFDDARDALQHLFRRVHFGKICIKVSQ